MPGDLLFLGLDVGTQSLRAALFDGKGRCAGYATCAIETRYPRPSWAEQSAEDWWRAARAAVPQALKNAGVAAEAVAAIGLDATACTVIPCRRDGTPVRPALLWMDQRSHREAADISATGDPSLRYVSGNVSPEWMLPKALWLKRNEPDQYRAAERVVECTDWLMFHLTDEWTLSLNHVAVKWNYVKPLGGWSPDLLGSVGLADLVEKWPSNIVPLGGGSGRLGRRAAADLGLAPGTPVAQGGIDAYLGMIGLGAVGAGDLAMIMGSSTCHLAQSKREILGSGLLGCYPDATVPGAYTLEGGQTATGSIVEWYRRHFAGNEAAEAERTGRSVFEILDAAAAATPPGADGLSCLDYFQGNRCPRKDPLARGAFWGLTLAHGPGHILRSIYEATALGTRHILEDAAQFGFETERIFAGGGGAKSQLWLQIHADVLERPIYVPAETEACALGAAITAAVHAGAFPDLDAAAAAMARIDHAVEPQRQCADLYDELFARYLRAYDGWRSLA